MEALETYWADILYFVGDAKASEYQPLMRLPMPEFLRLLATIRKNHKPTP